MATTDLATGLTLHELGNRTGNRNLLKISEVLDEYVEWYQDAVWVPSNKTTSHEFVRRALLPTGSWRQLNKGIPASASQTTKHEEPMGMLEDESVVDERLMKLAPNKAQFRSDEDAAHVTGLGITQTKTFFYGNRGDNPEAYDGLGTRYNTLSLDNVHDNGGSGSTTTSIWIVQWGRDKVHMIYPQASNSGGVRTEDKGRERITDDYGAYYAWVTRFYHDAGIAVHDDRNVQRIANIDTSDGSATFDEDLLIEALNLMPMRGKGAVIYMNVTALTQAEIRLKDKTNVNWTRDDAFGTQMLRFRTHPVKLVDQILDTETAIT